MLLSGTTVVESQCVCVWQLRGFVCICSYNPRHYYDNNAELKQCIDEIASGFFSPEDPGLFRDIANTLLNNDK